MFMVKNRNHWNEVEALLGELIEDAKRELLGVGTKIIPTLTSDDLLQPNDYPELENNPEFRYEEGVVSGLQSAKIALKALRNDLEKLTD
jgi:hypothetical protein